MPSICSCRHKFMFARTCILLLLLILAEADIMQDRLSTLRMGTNMSDISPSYNALHSFPYQSPLFPFIPLTIPYIYLTPAVQTLSICIFVSILPVHAEKLFLNQVKISFKHSSKCSYIQRNKLFFFESKIIYP